jgi:hypothetical protein
MIKRVASAFAVFIVATPAMADCPPDVRTLVCTIGIYDPTPVVGKIYTPPPSACMSDVWGHGDAVQNAFNLTASSTKVQEEICRLAKIYIMNSSDAFWGFWENPKTRTTTGTKPNNFVGLSGKLVHNNMIATQEDRNLNLVLINPSRRDFSHASNDNSNDLAVLSVILHEIGHIKWHRDNIFSSLSCYYDTFVGNSWDANSTLANFQANPWHLPPSDPSAAGGTTRRGNVPDPHEDMIAPGRIRMIYEGGFANAFAAISPEEDFVETYKLMVLKKVSQGLSLTLNLPGSGANPIDISDINRHAFLSAKADCVRKYLID